MTEFGVSLARVGRSAAGARIAAAGLAFHEKQQRAATAPELKAEPEPVPATHPGEGRAVSCREIIHDVARRHGIAAAEIISRSRIRSVGAARTEAMYRCVAETHLSLPAIARIFGRDHTSVGAAVIRHHLKSGLPLPRGMKARSFGLARQRSRTRARGAGV